jgi:hypothetical protein
MNVGTGSVQLPDQTELMRKFNQVSYFDFAVVERRLDGVGRALSAARCFDFFRDLNSYVLKQLLRTIHRVLIE